jgi:hypothetical protein
MNLAHRFTALPLCITLVLIAACNPVPLSVVASDFSINDVKGTSETSATSFTNTPTTTTTTATTTPIPSSTTTNTNTGATTSAATPSTVSVQNVTIDLTSKESCSNLTSLVAKVVLDEGVTISPNPAVARDYTSPVTFTVTEAYGGKVTYNVTVKGKTCAPAPTTPTTPRTTPGTAPNTCTPVAIGSTGYSLVFKACDTGFANNTASYYDKTECVRDNATGLIWEGKTATGSRAVGDKYNNLDSTSLLQIPANTAPTTGVVSPARSPTQTEIDDRDNSIGYKNNVNALNLCGFKDWRMPTKDELQSLRLPGAPGNDKQIDLTWFPNTNFDGYYATSTQFGTQADRSSVVQFGAGTVDNLLRYGTVLDATSRLLSQPENSVRLVRSKP